MNINTMSLFMIMSSSCLGIIDEIIFSDALLLIAYTIANTH